MKFVAFTVKGLENIVEKEILTNLEDAEIIEKRTKVLIFEYGGNLHNLLTMKTADDIGLYLSNIATDSLLLNKNTINNALKIINSLRHIDNTFSVTSSIVSKKIDKDILIESLLLQLVEFGLNHTLKERTNLDFRVFINDDFGLLAIRLTKEPLNKRSYETDNYLGALKPTIASAMVLLTTEGLQRDSKVVDNFCGSGTILCEAHLENFNVFGGDINPTGVTLTRRSLKELGNTQTENIKILDATKTKWDSAYFDCAISNLPWDKQHEVTNITGLYAKTILEYKRILKPNFKLCIICHKPELLIKHIKKVFGEVTLQRIDIGYLGQTPAIVLATS